MRVLKRLLLWLVVLGLAAGVAGFAFARLQPERFTELRRELRLALGLPKLWSTAFNTDTRGVAPVPCPAGAIVLVTGGQSNAGNAFADPLVPPPDSGAYMMLNGRCYPVRDPVLGATGDKGSLWTGLGPALAATSGRPVIFINGAVGGSQLGDWVDARSGYLRHLAGEVAAARRAGVVPARVIWIQGETDAAVQLDPALYVGQMQALMAAFDATGALPADVPWIVFRSTRCKARANNGPAIDAAVTAWAAATPRVVLGPDASALGNAERWDDCHFNGRGRDALVAATLPLLLN
jgi:hypothetical protein